MNPNKDNVLTKSILSSFGFITLLFYLKHLEMNPLFVGCCSFHRVLGARSGLVSLRWLYSLS